MFLLNKLLIISAVILLALEHRVNCSKSRSNEHSKDDPTDGIFHPEKTTSTSKKARPETRWPAEWITDQMSKRTNVPAKSDSASPNPPPLAENIKCSMRGHSGTFTADISLPFGFGNVPLFEDAPATLNPLTSEECQMRPLGGKYLMKINDFARCGVTSQKARDGKEWLEVSIVFPYLGGLRTSDDEHIMIMCKPQDRIATKSHVMDYKSNMPSGRKSIYHSPNQELDTKILMYTRKGSSSSFSEEVSQNALIEVGQDLQFRAIVRPGDGWKFAKLKDLTIQRMSHGNNEKGRNKADRSATGDIAYLVMEDGCRNPVYSAVAPKHPSVDVNNPLAVNFVFKAFMFQDMVDGDTLRISAKIVACQEQSDCQPAICGDDELSGHGRRRKRSLARTAKSHFNSDSKSNSSCIHDWTRDFQFNVVLPGFSKNRIDSNTAEMFRDGIRFLQNEDVRCRNVIFATCLISMILVVTTAVVAIVSLRSKQDIIRKYSSQESLPTSASLASSPPASGMRKDPNVPVLIGSSSIQGFHTRILNTSQ